MYPVIREEKKKRFSDRPRPKDVNKTARHDEELIIRNKIHPLLGSESKIKFTIWLDFGGSK